MSWQQLSILERNLLFFLSSFCPSFKVYLVPLGNSTQVLIVTWVFSCVPARMQGDLAPYLSLRLGLGRPAQTLGQAQCGRAGQVLGI